MARPSADAGSAATRFITSARAIASSAAAALSSSTENWPGTFASNGNWCSSRSQKAWMVWIFSPPGVSSARAKSRRASRISSAVGRAALQRRDRLARARLPAASPIRRACRRRGRAISAAATLVKVRQRIAAGSAPASSSRMTRCVSTCVLPEPALAMTQADERGSEALALDWCVVRSTASSQSRRIIRRPLRPTRPIRRRARDGRSRRHRRARASGSCARCISRPARRRRRPAH